jgi:hypothetical protein
LLPPKGSRALRIRTEATRDLLARRFAALRSQ